MSVLDDFRGLRGLVFDLDGTLLDSYPVHTAAYHEMLAHFGIAIDDAALAAVYSPNWYQVYRAVGVPAESWEEADVVWQAAAARQQPVAFQGVQAALDGLRRDYRLGLVTAGSRPRVIRDLNSSGLGGFFDAIVTGDDVQQPKPAPQGLVMALQMLDMAPDEVLYVGDTFPDYEMARTTGVRFVGVPSRFAHLADDLPCLRVAAVTDLANMLRAAT